MNEPDLILIGCTKTKRTEPSPARDLYDPSDLFRRRREYAEMSGKPWAILSALYGVVNPDRVIEPYDTTIDSRRTKDGGGLGWAVGVVQACHRIAGTELRMDNGHLEYATPITVEVHAGVDYVRTIQDYAVRFAEKITLLHPVAGLAIGEQKQWYSLLKEEAHG